MIYDELHVQKCCNWELPHVVEKILNHKQNVLIETYHRYDYSKERAEAFRLWGEWIENLVHSQN